MDKMANMNMQKPAAGLKGMVGKMMFGKKKKKPMKPQTPDMTSPSSIA